MYDFHPTLLEEDRDFGSDGVFAAVAAYSFGSLGGKLACGWAASRTGDVYMEPAPRG